jgi:hypothetical protein
MGASDSVDRWWLIAEGAVPASVPIKAVETEGLGGVVWSRRPSGDVQVAGVFDSREDGLRLARRFRGLAEWRLTNEGF